LPDWDDNWLISNVAGKYGEDRYNRFASRLSGRHLLDRDLICVKRLDGSDTLIHLFEQVPCRQPSCETRSIRSSCWVP
jgi:hypothetical protein